MEKSLEADKKKMRSEDVKVPSNEVVERFYDIAGFYT